MWDVKGSSRDKQPSLSRSLGLTLALLSGLGVTIGAGIYVLIAPAVARAGMHAPISAALVMAPSAASFAELGSRLPRAAGEATYATPAFGEQNHRNDG